MIRTFACVVSLFLGLGRAPAQDTTPSVGPPVIPGVRVPICGGEADLFIPEGYKAREGVVHVVLQLHGAPSVVEPALVRVGWPAVLVEFNRKGLSSVYAKPFADAGLLPRLRAGALKGVKEAGLVDEPKPGLLVVSSFSAGFGGVRDMLKVPENFKAIDALVMADSLYAGYANEDAKARVPDPKLIGDFARFAREAAAGRKGFVLTHSAQVPGTYASTTETADALISAVQGMPKSERVDRGAGWTQARSFHTGRFLVLGFEGEGPQDHMAHLRRIDEIWKQLPVTFP